MALDTRLIGQALGLGRPANVAGALEPAMQKGEKIFAEQRARREREQVRARQEQIRQENNTAKAVGLLQNIDESGVATNLRPYITQNALKIRNEAIEKIKAAKTPAEKLTATMDANAKIGALAAQSSDFNNYLKNFADLKPEDISKLNQEGLGEQITSILDGKYEVTSDGKFNFGNGKIADFNQVVNTNYINKRSDKYLELLKIADNVGTKYGLAGTSSGFFKDKLKNSLSTVEMSDLDLMSVAVDHFGIEDFKGEELKLVERVKEDFDEDGDIDDVELRTQLREAINGRIQAASETVFGKAKAEYDKKIKIKDPTSTELKEKQRISDLKTFIIDFERNKSLFGIDKNPAGVFTGKINIEDPNLSKALSQINYEIVDKFATSEDDPTLTSIRIKKMGDPNSRAIEIQPNESAQIFARKLMEDRGGTAEEAYTYGYQFTEPNDYSQYKINQ
ncbi:MAG: hypothetical protein VW894_03140 [Gammaproteobacteria bacterium]